KKWQNVVSESYFVDLHMSRSPECLLIYHGKRICEDSHPGILTLVEIEDELDHTRLLHDPFMDINMAHLFPGSSISLVGSVNGLIIQQGGISVRGEYKVLRILGYGHNEIEVHTLGTDQWRSLEVPKYLKRMQYHHGIFFKGHIYWIVHDQLFSFDLDNETFQLSPFPPLPDCLGDEEHGVEKYWQIENFNNLCTLQLNNLFPICLVDGLNSRSIFKWVMGQTGS
ncbi:F-box protein-like protein, partial [Tanacetum coccineum]